MPYAQRESYLRIKHDPSGIKQSSGQQCGCDPSNGNGLD